METPSDPIAQFQQAQALHQAGQLDEAAALYQAMLVQFPGNPLLMAGLGMIALQQGKLEEGVRQLEAALQIEPNQPMALSNLGVALRRLRHLDQALAALDRAIALAPDLPDAHNSRGNVLRDLGRMTEAVESYGRAIALKPNDAQTWCNRGQALTKLRRFAEALADYDHAIALDPAYPQAYWNKAILKLLTGELEEGWKLHEWRWKGTNELPRSFPQPLWLGDQPVAGKTVLIHADHGYGDFILCCRYIPMIEALGAKVVVEVFDALVPLVATLKGNFTLVTRGQPLPPFDLHCPVMSLPLAFGTTLDTIPAEVPYLFADSARREVWRERLGPRARMRVGLALSGNPAQQDNHNRSVPAHLLAPLFALPVDFHVLQKGFLPGDAAELARFGNVTVHEKEIGDFADTAALMEEMDLVISMCTSIANLAGAMGRPLWVLLSYAADWRWLVDRSDSPWYPTATLFRQPGFGDWPAVIAEVCAHLKTAAQESNTGLEHVR